MYSWGRSDIASLGGWATLIVQVFPPIILCINYVCVYIYIYIYNIYIYNIYIYEYIYIRSLTNRALCKTKLLPVTYVLVDTQMLIVKPVYKL